MHLNNKTQIYEEVNCDYCNSAFKKIIFKKHGLLYPDIFKVVKCNECGLIYVSPRLKEKYINKLYAKSYYGEDNTGGITDYWNDPKNRLHKAQYLFNIVESIRTITKNDKILDIGCGKGDFIKLLKSKGFSAVGTEYSKFACRELKSQGFEIHNGDVAKGLLEGNTYDTIVSSSVIEHVYSPKSFLKSIYNLLNKDGIFLCTTDIAEHFLKKEGTSWKQLTPDVHLYYFGKNSFKNYFNCTGFIEADQYHYAIDTSRRINKLMKRMKFLKNNRPKTVAEKIWLRIFLKRIDYMFQYFSGKRMLYWNIPLMRKIDL